jgi:membrane protease YdiL (CAAX protease family)
LHYAYPTLFGCAFLVVAITAMGWWHLTLFDKQRSGPRWAWVGPIAMLLVALASCTTINSDDVTGSLVMWSVLGGIGVGFGEEMITRGAVLTGFRSEFSEGKVWLNSTLAFSALHLPNVLFGLDPGGVVPQLVLTFVVGSMFYAVRTRTCDSADRWRSLGPPERIAERLIAHCQRTACAARSLNDDCGAVSDDLSHTLLLANITGVEP